MDCPVCGSRNEAGAAFCYQCGSALRPAGGAVQPVMGPTVDLSRTERPPPPDSIQTLEPEEPATGTGSYGSPIPMPSASSVEPSANAARVYDVPTGGLREGPPSSLESWQSPPSPARVYDAPTGNMPPPYVVTAAPGTARTSTLAVVALILGITSFMFLPFVGGIGAIITGMMGRREIRASGGLVSGDGLALAGLILGYINVGLSLLLCCVLPASFGFLG